MSVRDSLSPIITARRGAMNLFTFCTRAGFWAAKGFALPRTGVVTVKD